MGSSSASGPRPESADAGADGLPELDEIESLEAAGDGAALMDLAREKRAEKDLAAALRCYEAAARLGHADASYAAALFHMTGGVVPQDLKEGTARLRAAADGGVVAAKIYMGNLYELGVHFKADAEKADVWYRAAARAAGVEGEPGSPEYVRALAELGAARFVDLAASGATEEELARWKKKASTLGLALKARISSLPGDIPRDLAASAPIAPRVGPKPTASPKDDMDDALAALAKERDAEKRPARAESKRAAEPDGPAAKTTQKSRKAESAEGTPRERMFGFTPSLGLRAFGVAALFMIGALAAGWFGMEGARLLSAGGTVLPLVDQQPERVFFAILALVGVLPSLLSYRFRTWVASLGGGAVFASVGFFLHGSPQGTLTPSRPMQSLAFALAGYLACLLVFGVFGGAKPKREAPAKKVLARKLVDED
jgi:TPR repeat protein